MAVQLQASFDHIATADLPTYLTYRNNGSVEADSPVGNNIGTNTFSTISQFSLPTPSASIWAHFRVKQNVTDTTYAFFLAGGQNSVDVALQIGANGRIIAYRTVVERSFGSTTGHSVSQSTALGTGSVPLNNGTWYSVQVELTLHDSTGIIKTWVNGAPDLILTGIDTIYNNATGLVHNVAFCSNCDFDDIVVGDTTSPNAAPTEVRVDCMMPNADGTDSTMTRSTGAVDYELVDEVAASAGVSDYWYADAVGEKTSVNVAALTNTGGTIVAVQCTVYATKNEAGPCGFKIYVLRGGTRYYSDEISPPFGGWQFYRKVWNVDPSTSAAWTEANFNAAEFGVERTT